MEDLSAVTRDLAPTGTLRAAINLGNPVLAHGTPAEPGGITVDLAREVAARLAVPVEFACFDAARKSFEALTSGAADLGFLAIEPARADRVTFTAPYVLIEGVYVVADGSPLASPDDVDRPDVRIGVKQGSAYDLYLTRTLRQATIVRGEDGVTAFEAGGLEVAAGIRRPMTDYVAAHPGTRVVPGRFMEIRQAVCTTPDRAPETLAFLHEVVEELKATGFVADALRRADQDATVAPPA